MDDWMKYNLVSDTNCNTVNIYNPQKNLQGTTNYVGLTFGVGDTIPQFTISIEQND